MARVSAIDRRAFLMGRPAMDRTRPGGANLTPAIAAISDACLARAGIACMSCRDACPEQAIRPQLRRGGPFLPEVAGSACTGCGACIPPCPAHAIALSGREPAADV